MKNTIQNVRRMRKEELAFHRRWQSAPLMVVMRLPYDYDPDKSEICEITLRGVVRRVHRQVSSGPARSVEVTPELNAKYVGIIKNTKQGRKRSKYRRRSGVTGGN